MALQHRDGKPGAAIDLVVALPSYNEAETIAAVTAAVDIGLASMHDPARCVIVNADNRSTDGTRERFLDTSTRCRKHYEPTSDGVLGKGTNVLNALRLAAQWDARAVAFVDADLNSISPDWVVGLLEPVVRDGIDAVTPCYSTSQGGPLRNLISRPLTYGLFTIDVDQPTGGEISLSPRLANHILGQSRPRSALGYGIDIFLVTSAAMFTGRMAVVNLSRKVHRRRKWSTIAPIAQQVLETILSQAAEHRGILRQYTEITTPIRYGTLMADDEIRPAPGAMDESLNSELIASFASGMRQWREIYDAVFPRRLMDELHDRASAGAGIPAHTWRQALLELTAKSVSGTLEHATAAAIAMPLFNARMVTYAKEIATLSPQRLEQLLASERTAIFDSRAQVLRAPQSRAERENS
jgi:glucosylglycerate synthase